MFPRALRAFGNRLHEKYKMVSKKSITFFFSHKKKKKIQTHGIYTALGELKKKEKKRKGTLRVRYRIYIRHLTKFCQFVSFGFWCFCFQVLSLEFNAVIDDVCGFLSQVTCFAEAGGQHVSGMARAVELLGLRACLAQSTMDAGEGLPASWVTRTTDECIQVENIFSFFYFFLYSSYNVLETP